MWFDLLSADDAPDGGPCLWQGIVEVTRSSISLCFAREDQVKQHGRPASIENASSDVFVTVAFLKKNAEKAFALPEPSSLGLSGGQTQRPIRSAAKRLKFSESGGAIKMEKPPQDDAPHFVGFRDDWQHLTGLRVGGNNPGYIQNNTTLRGGLWIGDVDAGSPAAMAGLTSRDALVGLGPWEILSESHLRFVDRQLRMGKLESPNLKVHVSRIGAGLLSSNITLDAKKMTDIGTLVLSTKFRPVDLDGVRFGNLEDSVRPRPAFQSTLVIKPEEAKDEISFFPTLGNGIEEVGLIVGVRRQKSMKMMHTPALCFGIAPAEPTALVYDEKTLLPS